MSESEDEEKNKAPGKPKVYKIIISNLTLTKNGWKASSKNVIIKDGYDSYVKKYGEFDG